MKIGRHFLDSLVGRFNRDIRDEWIRSQMESIRFDMPNNREDPAYLHHALQTGLERIFVPTQESIRIAEWIYCIARGFINHRYTSPQEYVDICMTPIENASSLITSMQRASDEVPIYAVDGLPGVGKSALFKGLKRLFPAPMQILGEGYPPQRINTVSAVWVSVLANFSLKNWMISTLLELGIDPSKYKGFKNTDALSLLLYKAMYRVGIAAIIVDELQFAAGKTSARKILSQILAMRVLGVPIIFFANTDFLENIEQTTAQVSQRVPRARETYMPLLHKDPEFQRILEAQLSLVPFGHTIDVENESANIYDMVAGSPRGTARLIDLASATTIFDRRKLTLQDLVEAKRSPSFNALRKHIALLTATAPVDPKLHPELLASHRQFNPQEVYKRQLAHQKIEDAASVALHASLSATEQEAARAIEAKILRDSGKIPGNVTALGESKRSRAPQNGKNLLNNSYAAKKMAGAVPKNPIQKNSDTPKK